MPVFEDDGSDGDSGEEDSMGIFREEPEEDEDERAGRGSASGDGEDDESASEKGRARRQGEGARSQSGSEEEQENYESGSERDASYGSILGEEEETAENTAVTNYPGERSDEDENGSERGESRFLARRSSFLRRQGSLRTLTNCEQDFGYDSGDGMRNANSGDGERESIGLVAFSRERSPSEQEYRDGSSERDDSGAGGAAKGAVDGDTAGARKQNGAAIDEEEIDGEIEEKESDDDYEAEENGDDDDDEEFRAGGEIPAKSAARKPAPKPQSGGPRTNIRNGEYVPRLSKAFRARRLTPDPQEDEDEEEDAEEEREQEPAEEEASSDEDDDEEEEGQFPSPRIRCGPIHPPLLSFENFIPV